MSDVGETLAVVGQAHRLPGLVVAAVSDRRLNGVAHETHGMTRNREQVGKASAGILHVDRGEWLTQPGARPNTILHRFRFFGVFRGPDP
jgi:hypothetical protein